MGIGRQRGGGTAYGKVPGSPRVASGVAVLGCPSSMRLQARGDILAVIPAMLSDPLPGNAPERSLTNRMQQDV